MPLFGGGLCAGRIGACRGSADCTLSPPTDVTGLNGRVSSSARFIWRCTSDGRELKAGREKGAGGEWDGERDCEGEA